MTERVIIIGASAAGVGAALELRKQGFDGDVTLLSGEDRLPYERPAVSKDILQNGVAAPILAADAYVENRLDLRLNTWARRLDLLQGGVELGDGSMLTGDRILLATGGRVRRLTVQGAALGGVHYARSAADAEAIHAGLLPGANVAIIGGGLIGAEIAASATLAGCRVTWIEAAQSCLTRALASPFDRIMMDIHRTRGVKIITEAAVSRLHGDVNVRRVELSDGRGIDTDLVVIGIGIEPVTDLASGAGLTVAGGIVVDRCCVTSNQQVFAAGDVAVHQTDFMAVPGRMEHWRHAQNQGASAARSMLGVRETYNELSWFWTDQYEYHIEGCGVPQPTDQAVIRGAPDDGGISVFYLRAGRLSAAVSLNRPKDVRAAMRLIPKNATVSSALLADPSVDLRRVERETAHGVA
jgi:3-phenylpropionate/trans-cinnamate dioxygenase ferredoxin reductase subunit